MGEHPAVPCPCCGGVLTGPPAVQYFTLLSGSAAWTTQDDDLAVLFDPRHGRQRTVFGHRQVLGVRAEPPLAEPEHPVTDLSLESGIGSARVPLVGRAGLEPATGGL